MGVTRIVGSPNVSRCYGFDSTLGADAILTGDGVTKFKAIANKNVFPCVKCEVSFPHGTTRITTAQDARVIVVGAKKMKIDEACRRGFFRTNFEASEVGCSAVSQTDVL